MAVHGMTKEERTLEEQLSAMGNRMTVSMYADKLGLLRSMAHERGASDTAQSNALRMIKYLTSEKLESVTEEREQLRMVGMLRDAYQYRGRLHFHEYLVAMEWDRKAEHKFYEPRKRVLSPIVQDLQDLADGVIDIYGLSMPPRTGKTTLGLLYTTWLAGRNPTDSVLSAGYSSALVASFYDGCQDFITSHDYRFSDIFPNAPLVGTSAKGLTLDLEKNKRYKTLTFRSIDGSVTGATEAKQLLYLDDLVSGIEEAMNINRLETLWSKVSSDMLQRRKEGCPMLVIGTRWSLHDPIGRIELKYEDNPRARFKRLSATDSAGHSNFVYDYGVGFNDEYYEELKGNLDSVTWECVFQQNPMERDGLLYPDLKKYFELPRDEPDDIYAFCDVAFGGEDSLSLPIAYQYGEDAYIEDVVFMRGGYEITEPIVSGKIVSHSVRRAVFEANNGGDFYSRDVATLVQDAGHHCNIMAIRAPSTQSKLSRIVQHSPAVKNFYFRDSSTIRDNSMYLAFMHAMETFNLKNKHDDAPDSCSGLAEMSRKFKVSKMQFHDRKTFGI